MCVLISQGENHFLLTGDLEAEGEESLLENNPDLPKVKLFKAGHHGSYTASGEALLEKIQPEIVCVCCCAGSVEYLRDAQTFEDLLHSFPAQEAIDRIAKWTDRVYVTTLGQIALDESGKYEDVGFGSMNGNIVVSSGRAGDITVLCSNNDTLLKDTEWFKENRRMPAEWA